MFLVGSLEENYIHNAYTALLRKTANIPCLINKNTLFRQKLEKTSPLLMNLNFSLQFCLSTYCHPSNLQKV